MRFARMRSAPLEVRPAEVRPPEVGPLELSAREHDALEVLALELALSYFLVGGHGEGDGERVAHRLGGKVGVVCITSSFGPFGHRVQSPTDHGAGHDSAADLAASVVPGIGRIEHRRHDRHDHPDRTTEGQDQVRAPA